MLKADLTSLPIKNLTIADDDWDDQILLQETIDTYAHAPAVKTVSDGNQLMLSLAVKPLPDLIFLDLNMPNKNGIECLNEIRSDNGLKHLPIVVFSTSKDLRDIESCYAEGANLFLSKPYTFNSMKAVVHAILSLDWNLFPPRRDKNVFVKIAMQGLIPEIA